ncbi:transmembrane protein [Anaeramoeba flamelloides]|uniref:Transmembrane protein n=1 Tax=Anaeramoeba flamelloides TaxID=1746091 RepID=A0AAV8AKR7_9EUKA|nr:transmembrane protein [Anaeramoeba flamelloides]
MSKAEIFKHLSTIILNEYDQIDFNETFFVGVVIFYVTLILFITLIRKYVVPLLITLFTLIFLALSGTSINNWLLENWHLFLRKNYFEEEGILVAFFWTTPLLFIALYDILWLFGKLVKWLAKMKKEEMLREIQKAEEKLQQEENSKKGNSPKNRNYNKNNNKSKKNKKNKKNRKKK